MLNMRDGHVLKAAQKRLRLKDAEVCAEAGVSIGTLHRVYNNHPTVTDESVNKVLKALEVLRQKLARTINAKAFG
jgi:DNA-binding LacI/PurR family transcriptional regulator